MSRKSKKLEKENETMKKKSDRMSSNIAKMAEERTKHLKDIDDSKKKEETNRWHQRCRYYNCEPCEHSVCACV